MPAGPFRALALAASFALTALPAHAVMLYGSETVTNNLFLVDTETNTTAAIGKLGFSGVTGLAFDSAGRLWGVDDETDQFLSVDPATGAATAVGALGFSEVRSMTFGPGDVLYAGDQATNQLLTIDTATGAATAVGGFGLGPVAALAFDADRRLIGVKDNGIDGPREILEIDPDTGLATVLGPFASRLEIFDALTLGPDGELYILNSRGDRISRLDPDALTGEFAANVAFDHPTSLAARSPAASAPIPLPAPAAMLLLGVAGLGAARLRRPRNG